MKIITKEISYLYFFKMCFKKYFASCLFFSCFLKFNILLFKNLKISVRYWNSFGDLLFFGLIKGYIYYIQIVGSGYKFRLLNIQNWFGLILRLGFSHLIFINLLKNIRIRFFNKTMLCLYTEDLYLVKNKLYSIFMKKKLDIYKGKGIFLKNQILKLKKNKKLKF